jgi:hypothetical protein
MIIKTFKLAQKTKYTIHTMNETGSLTKFTQTKAKLHFLINPYKKIHIKIIEEMKAKVHRRIKPSTNCYSKHLDGRYQPGAFLLE